MVRKTGGGAKPSMDSSMQWMEEHTDLRKGIPLMLVVDVRTLLVHLLSS